MADNATAVGPAGDFDSMLDTTTAVPRQDIKYDIIVTSVVGGIVLVTAITIYLIWFKLCKSPRSKHGNERVEADVKGKKDYYDQFNVNDHQLTINSVTAIKWDEDEKRSNKSSGIDCDSHSNVSKEERKVVTGKKVFSVNKVPEKQARPANTNGVVIRLPKQYAELTRSLQAGDAKNYTLAIIDKQSQTVHNIDLRNYRVQRALSPHRASGSGAPARIHHHRRRHRSEGIHKSGVQSASEMLHDSPDLNASRKKGRGVMSADERETQRTTNGSLTDFSDTTNSSAVDEQRRSVSLSSHDEEGDNKELISQSSKTTAAADEVDATVDSEREVLLHDYQ